MFLHEAGHAVFEMLNVPLFGREEDAADQFSVYIMLKMEKDEARRLIMGNAYQYKGDLSITDRVDAAEEIRRRARNAVATVLQVLCLAYGANKELFADFVSKGFLPEERAEGCEVEYAQVQNAFNRLIMPSVDRKLAQQAAQALAAPVDTRPKKRR